MNGYDKDYRANCNWWVTDGKSERDTVFGESLWGWLEKKEMPATPIAIIQ